MMKRFLPSFAIAAATLGAAALMHCGGETEPNDAIGGGGASEAGTSGGSSSSGPAVSSSGQAGTSSSGSGGLPDSGPDAPPIPQRIQTKVGLPTASAGCGSANAPPTRGVYSYLPSGRAYIPYQPGAYNNTGPGGGTGYPVMIALHGCYGDPAVFGSSAFMGFQDAVGNDGIVVYGAAVNPTTGCTWDVGGQSDIDYLDALIAEVAARFCIDESRVMLLGFSWGSYMSHYYACNRPGTIKAVAGGAGGYPDWFAGSVDPAVCGQVHSLVYGRTADPDEQIWKSYNARDKRKAIANCNGGDIGAPMPAPPNDGSGSYCTEATGCDNGLYTTFCEDKYVFTQNNYFNHTIYKPWHRPIWDWFTNLP